jgi:hypothetical protein
MLRRWSVFVAQRAKPIISRELSPAYFARIDEHFTPGHRIELILDVVGIYQLPITCGVFFSDRSLFGFERRLARRVVLNFNAGDPAEPGR